MRSKQQSSASKFTLSERSDLSSAVKVNDAPRDTRVDRRINFDGGSASKSVHFDEETHALQRQIEKLKKDI